MDTIVRTLVDPATYRRLVYLLLGLPLGTTWFIALVTVWSLCSGPARHAAGDPAAVRLASMTRGFAAVEAEIARSLLDVDAQRTAPPPPSRSGFWARFRAHVRRRASGGPRRSSWLRSFVGFPIAVVLISLLGTALSLIFAPLWVPFVHGGAQTGLLASRTRSCGRCSWSRSGLVAAPADAAAGAPAGQPCSGR